MHSIVYGSAPRNIISQYTTNEYRHNHMLSFPRPRNNLFKTSLLYSGGTVWNNLLQRLKSIANKHAFKTSLKKHLLNYITYSHLNLFNYHGHFSFTLNFVLSFAQNWKKIRSFLSNDAANRLAVSLILSRLDYCNSPLAGIPDNKLDKLQRIQNHSARLVLRKSRHVSATALLRTLHWLPVKAIDSVQYCLSLFSAYLSEQYATLYFGPSSSILSL